MTATAPQTRVLVVDDEPLLLRAVRRMLERDGYEVSSFSNGADALAELDREAQKPYSLILCDLRMPGSDGRWVYSRLEERHPDLLDRLVFITGDADVTERREFLASSGCAVLVKPFTGHQLSKLVETVLEKRRRY